MAGPVVAAAVILPPGCCIAGAADSKTLAPVTRERLYDEILEAALVIGIGAASVKEVDALNILRATTLAMKRALLSLKERPDHIVVDGLPVRDLGWDHDAVVGGDGVVHSISCASIVAKVCRDRLMCRLAKRYPAYGWDRNMGYGTPGHLRAILEVGRSVHHRMSFGAQLGLGLEE
jgi:ribonuclease HII